jgi:hypothetical protein
MTPAFLRSDWLRFSSFGPGPKLRAILSYHKMAYDYISKVNRVARECRNGNIQTRTIFVGSLVSSAGTLV